MAEFEQPKVPVTASYWPGSQTEDSAYKRTGKTKKDLLKCYDQRIKMSQKWRGEEFEKTWKRLIDLYRGKHFTGTSTDHRIAVNISFSTVNVIVPSVAVNYPVITVNPRTPEQAEAADVAESAVNYWWRLYDWRDETKKAVKDSLVIGHGWIKLGWKYEERDRPVTPEEKQAAYGEAINQANAAAESDPAIAADLPSDEDIYDSLDSTVPEVKFDHPFVERVSPFDILIDPEATAPSDLKWIAQRIVAPIERIRSDSRYKQSARKELKADMSTNPRWRDDDNTTTRSNKNNDDIQRVTIWEYWDIEHEFYCVFANDPKDFLVEPTHNPYVFGIPFVPLLNYEVPDQFYSVGDLEQLEPLQHELNGVRSDMMNHRKRWQRAYIARRDGFDPEAQNVLMSDKDGRVAWVDGDAPLQDLIYPVPQIPLEAQMYNYSQQIENDLQMVSGITEYQRGSAPEIRRTATEANLIQSATNARVSDKLAQIEHFIAEVAERIIQLAQQYLTGEQVTRIVHPAGPGGWVKFSREDIEGQFDFMVEAGSTQPRDEQFRRQNAVELLQVLQPFMGQVADPQKVLAYVLNDGFGISDVQRFMMDGPPPERGPSMKLIETMSYKDAPPDIQRQMEQEAGFQPSQQGGTSPPEQQAQDQQHQMVQQQFDQRHQQDQQAEQQAHEQEQAQLEAQMQMAQAAIQQNANEPGGSNAPPY